MYAQLGDITFDGLFAYHEYEDTGETRYAEVDLIGGKPDLQHTGGELDVITLSIRLHESFCEPLLRYGQFHAHRINCDILPFVDGYGAVIGNFVIQKIKRNVNQTDTYGRVILCECELTLKEYVDPNRAITISNDAKDNAIAINAIAIPPGITYPPPNANADVLGAVKSLRSDTGSAIDSIGKAQRDTANVALYLKSAAAKVSSAYNTAIAIQTKVEDYVAQGLGVYTGVVDTIVAVQGNLTSLKTAINDGNLPAAAAGVLTLESSNNQLSTVMLPVQKLLILR